MNHLRDLLSVAVSGLLARKARVLLMTAGPLLGVAAIVGILGMSQSAKGRARATLRALGTDLVVVDANPDAAGSGPAKLPVEAAERVRRAPRVLSVAPLVTLNRASVLASRSGAASLETRSIQVRAADPSLPDVLRASLREGRFLNSFDEAAQVRVAVVGAEAAASLGMLPGETRAILVNDQLFGVVGVLSPVALMPTLDNSIFVTRSVASAALQDDGRPSQLLVQVESGSAALVAGLLPVAVTYGGPGLPTVRVPTQLLQASAAVDQTFQAIVLVLGALALLIGGFGITNVMMISVLQRAPEIGIRRALGHARSAIALQFLLESLIVGVAGGALGVAAGSAFVFVAARQRDWLVVLDPWMLAGAGLLAVVIAVAAGSYPATKAARLEPLQTLRLG